MKPYRRKLKMNVRYFAAALLAFFISSCDNLGSEITVYPVACEGEMKNGACKGFLLPLNETVYKVSANNQTIIYWMPGIWDEPSKLVNCIVRDRKNWVGEYIDGSAKLRMVNGEFHYEPSFDEFHVSKWRWWFAELTSGKDLRAYLF